MSQFFHFTNRLRFSTFVLLREVVSNKTHFSMSKRDISLMLI